MPLPRRVSTSKPYKYCPSYLALYGVAGAGGGVGVVGVGGDDFVGTVTGGIVTVGTVIIKEELDSPSRNWGSA
jgi:hypothetical protein